MANNLFLDGSNRTLRVVVPQTVSPDGTGVPGTGYTFVPLGTLNDSTSGAIAVKVLIVGDESNNSDNAVTVSVGQGARTITSAGTPLRLTAASTPASSVEIFGRKSPNVANTGNLFVGVSSSAGQNYRVVAPGTGFTISAGAGQKIDLTNIYVDASTSNDVAVYTYLP